MVPSLAIEIQKYAPAPSVLNMASAASYGSESRTTAQAPPASRFRRTVCCSPPPMGLPTRTSYAPAVGAPDCTKRNRR